MYQVDMKTSVALICMAFTIVGATAYAGTWSGDVKVATIEASDNSGAGGGVWLRFVTSPFSSHTCADKGGQYRLGGSSDNIKQMMTLAVSAQLSSRPIRVYWGGNCDGSGYPFLIGLELR
jgi:hypothetical protein